MPIIIMLNVLYADRPNQIYYAECRYAECRVVCKDILKNCTATVNMQLKFKHYTLFFTYLYVVSQNLAFKLTLEG
jgi:hypothetical protein